MKMLASPRKAYSTALEAIVNITCIFCLFRMLTYLCFMGNEIYQTLKNIQASHGFLYLAIFMFLTQRVRLVNWQSLAVSLLYWPIAYLYQLRFYPGSPDLYNRDRLVIWIVWLLLMILIDMAVYKKINLSHRLNSLSVFIFATMTILLIFYRNERTSPIILVVAFLFYLIPLNEEKWNKVTDQFCISWIVAFFYMLYRSLKYNAKVAANGRWYGDFLNIGDFGIFIACTITVILFQIYKCKKENNLTCMILYSICLLPVIWTALRVCTITMFIGVGCIFLIGFILLPKNKSGRAVIVRLLIVLISIPSMIILMLLLLKALSNTDTAYWAETLQHGSAFLKPLANLITRAQYMFNHSGTFSDSSVFTPNSLISYLDLFSSGRLSICKLFAEHFNSEGNISAGIQVGSYFATNAHNGYTQILYEYGYAGGGIYILWFFYSTGAGMIQYLKNRKTIYLLPCLWLAMALGVQLGEAPNLYSPLLVMTYIITYPLMVRIDNEKGTAS